MAFAEGLERGSRLARGMIDTYRDANQMARERAAEEEIAAINAQYQNTGEVLEAPLPRTGLRPDLVSGAQPMSLGAMQPQPAGLAPSGAPAQQPIEQVLQRAATPASGGLTARMNTEAAARAEQPARAPRAATPPPQSQIYQQQADIYARHGLTAQASRARDLAAQAAQDEQQFAVNEQRYLTGLEREDRQIQRSEEQARQTQQNWEATMAFQEAQAQGVMDRWEKEFDFRVEDRANASAFSRALGEKVAAGETTDVQSLVALAGQYSVDPTMAIDMAGAFMDLDEKQVERDAKAIVSQLSAAAARGVDGLNNYLASPAAKKLDPITGDDLSVQIKEIAPGVWAAMYGEQELPGTQLYTDVQGGPGWRQWVQDITSTLEGAPMAWAVESRALQARGRLEFSAANAVELYNTMMEDPKFKSLPPQDRAEQINTMIFNMQQGYQPPTAEEQPVIDNARSFLERGRDFFGGFGGAPLPSSADVAEMETRVEAPSTDTAAVGLSRPRGYAAMRQEERRVSQERRDAELAQLQAELVSLTTRRGGAPATDTPRGREIIARISELSAANAGRE
jgi:hypothetical protein